MAVTPNKKLIPDIPEREIRQLARRIRPVIRVMEHGLSYIRPVDPFSVYTDDPKIVLPARWLEASSDVQTYHAWSPHDYIRATVAEVLAQIPPAQLDGAVAFEVMGSPKSFRALTKDVAARIALEAGYHIATTRVYTRKK